MSQLFELVRTTWLPFLINKYKAGLPAEINQVPIYITQSLVRVSTASPELLCHILPCEQGLTYQKRNQTPVEDLYSQKALQSYPTIYRRRSQSSIRAVNINQKLAAAPGRVCRGLIITSRINLTPPTISEEISGLLCMAIAILLRNWLRIRNDFSTCSAHFRELELWFQSRS